ncbi:hypothetical protein PSENEW3_00000120 [Picochlorum sp. SENEW3]|nr:hypothetical protein PSENEW3_00000120 [Picochlorum sp. SENEW3]
MSSEEFPVLNLPSSVQCALPGSIVKVAVSHGAETSIINILSDKFTSSDVLRRQKSTKPDVALCWTERPEDEVPTMCLAAKIIEVRCQDDGDRSLIFRGMHRVTVHDTRVDRNGVRVAMCAPCVEQTAAVDTGLISDILQKMEVVLKYMPLGKQDASKVFDMLRSSSPSVLSDVLGSMLTTKKSTRKKLFETLDVQKRLEIVQQLLAKSVASLHVAMNGSSREDGFDAAVLAKIRERGASQDVIEAVEKELAKLKKMSEQHPGHSSLVNYIETLCDLPWNVVHSREDDSPLLDRVEEVLNRNHHGMVDVKKRIIEFVAIQMLQDNTKSTSAAPVLCLIGPPGTGKTSIARSIAEALGKPFQRISLGGVRDEAEIRGHRRTYIGSMPGRVIQAMKRAKVSDCILLLDEVDKTGRDSRGDPASALLELLDPEQNNGFMDHYIALPFDMSKVIFVATANNFENIPPPLMDRLECIHLPGYTMQEKVVIAKNHLLPSLIKKNAMQEFPLSLSDDILLFLISGYTKEAGVRGLTKRLDSLCRHYAVKIVKEGRTGSNEILISDTSTIEDILGPPIFEKHDRDHRVQHPGCAAGLVWEVTGGSVQYIECLKISSQDDAPHPRLTLTGRMGEVLNESAHIALNWILGHADEIDILDKQEIQAASIHIHLPSGAVRKDGPSAGVTILVALISLFSGVKVRSDTALTGEISLRGHVLPVGGIKEKVIAAHTAGMARVILPSKTYNEAMKCINDEHIQNLAIIPVSHVEQALENAFSPPISIDCDNTAYMSSKL